MAEDPPNRRNPVVETIDEFLSDECPRYAAAASYYAIFSLPALAALAALVLGLIFEPGRLQATVVEMVAVATGEPAAEAIRPILERVETPEAKSPVAWVVTALAVLLGGTGAFLQVQAGLNRAWYVQPSGGTVRSFLWKRVVSFALLGLLAVLLLAALGTSALALSAGKAVAGLLAEPLGAWVLYSLDLALSLAVLTLVIGAVLRLFPDAEIAWRDVIGGAFATALLVWVGKLGIAFYVARTRPGEAFGVAGSLALFLLWVYYSANLLFLGAEWTQVRARRAGRPIRPSPGASLTPRGRERVGDA